MKEKVTSTSKKQNRRERALESTCAEASSGGFTLVETLVAITVLLLVIIGPMTVAQKGIQNAYFATEQTTAVFLAQEALEAVRQYRDSAALEAFDEVGGVTAEWTELLHGSCDNTNGCAYLGGGYFGSCPPQNRDYENGGCRLKINPEGGYTHSAGANSPFFRKVVVSGSGGQAAVTVTVYWDAQIFGGAPREVVLQTWLYNHYQRYADN